MTTGKRLASLLLAVCMVVALAACGGGDAPQDTGTPATDGGTTDGGTAEGGAEPSGDLAYLDYGLLDGKPYDGTKLMMVSNSPGLDQFEMLQKFTREKFTPMTGIEVEWDQGPWEGVREKMITEAVAGSSTFDLYMVMEAWGSGLRNYMSPLNEYITRDGIDMSDFPASYIEYVEMGSDDGSIYGMPMRGHFQTIFYRKDLYEDLGLEIPATWDQMVDNSKAIMEANPGMYGISIPYGIFVTQNMMVWYDFFYSYGGEFFDAEMHPTFNSPESVAATQYWVDLMLKEKVVSPDNVTLGENDARVQMCQGESAHFLSWSWLLSRFNDEEFTADEVLGKVGTFAVPSFDGTNPAVTAVSMFSVGIPVAAQQKDAAWEYCKFLSDKDVMVDVMLDTSEYQVNTLARTSAMLDPQINEMYDGLWEFGAETLKTARTTPTIPEWDEVAALIELALNNCATGADVQAELDKAATQADAIMKAAGYY